MNGAGQTYDRNFTDNPLYGVTAPGTYLQSGFRSDVSTWAELAPLFTAGATLPVIIEWYDPIDSVMRTCVLMAGTDPTDTSIGVQRPDDYNGSTNAVVWYQAGNAG